MVRVMAPFSPFLTETMYQQLKKKVPAFSGEEFASVHYLMLPAARKDLIDEGIERAVGRMQAVVDLGRVLRERKTMPVKYPLPEVLVIHKDQQYLDDVGSLEMYIKEDLNVRKITLSSDKASYGVTLRAEPDHKTLGFRLKGAFKSVMAEIKTLSDETLTNFLNGGKLNIQGYDIEQSELRIMFSFAGERAAELAEKYEADSSEDLLVLLDITPDESMVKEGTAREVVIRLQKLRKAAGLVPSDEVTAFYSVKPADHDLAHIVSEYHDYLQTATKTPIRGLPHKPTDKVIKKEVYDVKGAKLELVIVSGLPSDYSGTGNGTVTGNGIVPVVPWANLQLVGCKPAKYVKSDKAGLLLPQNYTLTRLQEDVQDVYGLYGARLQFYLKPDRSVQVANIAELNGKVIYVFKANDTQSCGSEATSDSFNCKFVNIDTDGKLTTILLENPVGSSLDSTAESLKLSS